MSNSNPLLETHDLPRFRAIRPEHVLPALEAVLAENREAIRRALRGGQLDWSGLAEPLLDCEDRLQRCWGPVVHLHAVCDEPALREAFNAGLPLVTDYQTELSQNTELYRALKQLAAEDDQSGEQRRWLELELIDVRLGGAELDPERKARLAELRRESSERATRFNENVLDATNAWQMRIVDRAELDGLPESAIEAAAESAIEAGAQSGPDGVWSFTLHFPSFQPFMTFAADRKRREEMYRAYHTRAASGDLDNGPLIERILELRRESAELLGFAHWGERSLVKKMADSVEEVMDFLTDLARRSRDAAHREFEALAAFARERGGPDPLEAWDILYWAERMRQELYAFSVEEVRAYFPLDAALEGLIGVARRLYGLAITERSDVETWHDSVRYLEIRDEDGELRGGLYLDLFARPGKRSGAWADGAAYRRRTSQGVRPPIGYLVCNFSAPTQKRPSLLTHRDVLTLFHEFGHSLHHTLTRVDVPGVSGFQGVAWDAVELPSQFHENWAWQAEALEAFARHWQTGAVLPRPLLDKLIAAKNFQSGMAMVRQLEFALFDMQLHTSFDPGGPDAVQACLDRVRSEVAVVIPPDWNRFQNGFGHIFGGGYSAGYYSYKWAEVLAADAFSKFEENGIFDRDTGREFLHCILEKGGSEDAAALYRAFRGRPPSIDALLRQSGIGAGA